MLVCWPWFHDWHDECWVCFSEDLGMVGRWLLTMCLLVVVVGRHGNAKPNFDAETSDALRQSLLLACVILNDKVLPSHPIVFCPQNAHTVGIVTQIACSDALDTGTRITVVFACYKRRCQKQDPSVTWSISTGNRYRAP